MSDVGLPTGQVAEAAGVNVQTCAPTNLVACWTSRTAGWADTGATRQRPAPSSW